MEGAPALDPLELLDQGPVSGPVELTPIQRWFFEQQVAEPHHYNQALMLDVARGTSVPVLEAALQKLLVHHDALRLRFVRNGLEWKQTNAVSETHIVFAQVDLSRFPAREQPAILESLASDAQASLNLESGPIVRSVYFDLAAATPAKLLIVIHHLGVDGVSWRILLEDIQKCCEQAAGGLRISLDAKTTSFQRWARLLGEHARKESVLREAEYWTNELKGGGASVPVDDPAGANTMIHVKSVFASLTAEETRVLLQEVPSAYHTQINDVLLTALVLAAGDWAGQRRLLIDLEGHGREEILTGVDLSRTVGWFTTIFPVMLDIESGANEGEALKAVKEKLRSIPNRGIGYGLLRYLSQDQAVSERLRMLPQAAVSFNYLGQFDQMLDSLSDFGMANESAGQSRGLTGSRSHLIEIDASVTDGQIQIEWSYSDRIHHRSTIERLADAFTANLRRLADHCLARETRQHTPSDFPLARIEQHTLDRISTNGWRIDDIYPVSPMQEGMIFHSLLSPGSGLYCTQLACTLKGSLDASAFEQTWRAILDRHSILRTAFIWQDDGEPLQVVHRGCELPFDRLDWRSMATAEREAAFEAFLKDDRDKGFDPRRPPLMRLTLIMVAGDSHRFVWTCHHALIDGWCVPLLLKEALIFYEALCNDKRVQLEPARPYRGYIAWLKQQDLSGAETFWRRMLAGYTDPIHLTSGWATRVSTHGPEAYGEDQIVLPISAMSGLQALSRKRQLTLSTFIQGTWALLLSRYSGEDDVVFGMVFSGRPPAVPHVESIIGLFINTLPMRVGVSPEVQLCAWLSQIQARQTEMAQYEYSSLARIQQWSEVPGHQPLFESILAFENYPFDASQGGPEAALTMEGVSSIDRTNYPLTIAVEPDEELSIAMTYDSHIFDPPAIARMLSHFQVVLEGISNNIDRRLGDVSLLTEAEIAQLLFQWNDTDAEYEHLRSLPALFETCAVPRSDSIACVFGADQISYGTLDRKANQLARYLTAQGVQAGQMIGLYLERNHQMLVCMLGTLKAGAAYVPLDLMYPPDRLKSIIDDAGMTLLLTQPHLAPGLPASLCHALVLDGDWKLIAGQNEGGLSVCHSPDSLAYVIYTSGSTGKPKGICIPHQAVNRLVSNADYVRIGPSDRVLQASTPSFDAATFEIWGSLLNGACLVYVSREDMLAPRSLAAGLREQGITVMFLTTALFNQIAREVPGAFDAVDTVLFGGEQVDPKWPRLVINQGGPRRLLHVYGPTEATTFATWSLIANVPEAATIPIGNPISNTSAYTLNGNMDVVPIGATGELYLGGPGLARGYLGRPDQTAQGFVPDPFSHAGARLYRTGDLVRRTDDGQIEFTGRMDNQVKVRGFRIEPGEIEAVLRQHERVRDAVVTVTEDSTTGKRLVAYVFPDGDSPVSALDLRGFLKGHLPDFMVPVAFEVLEALPLTPNGKVDRSQLPDPSAAAMYDGRDYVAPRSQTEEALARMWAGLLKIERVGIHDGFFELGGHSLLATQIVSRINDTFRAGLSLQTFFEGSSIAEVSRALMAAETEPGKTERIAHLVNDLDRMPAEEVEHLLNEKVRGKAGR
ncbi:MAG TPA: amino acid adenylation domain-containing protein [Blastocatellia bacterium]|nr:amino acid adenylation domain-containing protein [Blastocatellia bacterium]